MATLTLSVKLTRTLLGLDDLELNDHGAYYISELGDYAIQWDRKTISTPWTDGDITVQRSRRSVERRVVIEVLGTTTTQMKQRARTLIDALSQDSYNMTVNMDGDSSTYRCEAADYTISWDKERAHSSRTLVSAVIRQSPAMVSGTI
jgi:hypothetical protein